MHIDILVHVQDNLGDMWFGAEIATHLQGVDKDTKFHFYTDDVLALERFLALQWLKWDRYCVFSQSSWYNHHHSDAKLFLVLFRTDFDMSHIESLSSGVNTLWIDYLTFDREIALLHGQEHIRSSGNHPIVHIVNSPLSWGLLLLDQSFLKLSQSTDRQIARQEWSDHLPYRLDRKLSSQIITVFSYDTQKHVQEISWCEWSVLGFAPVVSPQYLGDWQLVLPYIAIDQFYTLLALSDVAIVRWEVSLAAALQLWTPFYWDMYKEKGGWNVHEFESFLSWMLVSFDACNECGLFHSYTQSIRTLNECWHIDSDDIAILMTEGAKKVFLDIARRAREHSLIETILPFMRQG